MIPKVADERMPVHLIFFVSRDLFVLSAQPLSAMIVTCKWTKLLAIRKWSVTALTFAEAEIWHTKVVAVAATNRAPMNRHRSPQCMGGVCGSADSNKGGFGVKPGPFGAVRNVVELLVQAARLGGVDDVVGTFLDTEGVEFEDEESDAVFGAPGRACFRNNGEQLVTEVSTIGGEGTEIGEVDEGDGLCCEVWHLRELEVCGGACVIPLVGGGVACQEAHI